MVCCRLHRLLPLRSPSPTRADAFPFQPMEAATALSGPTPRPITRNTHQGLASCAYNADSISAELWNSTQNSTRDNCNNISKNAAPTIANGKVYLPSFGTANSGSGQLCVYGLLAGSPDFSLSATPGSQTVTPGGATSYTATVSALS